MLDGTRAWTDMSTPAETGSPRRADPCGRSTRRHATLPFLMSHARNLAPLDLKLLAYIGIEPPRATQTRLKQQLTVEVVRETVVLVEMRVDFRALLAVPFLRPLELLLLAPVVAVLRSSGRPGVRL